MATLPAAAAMIAITPLITPLAARRGSASVVARGSLWRLSGFGGAGLRRVLLGYAAFVLPLVAVAAGLGLANGPASSASTAAVATDQVGQASGISNMARYIGGSLAVAAAASVYDSVISSRTAEGASASDALAAGLSRASLLLASCPLRASRSRCSCAACGRGPPRRSAWAWSP